jgi:hypothetical protein
MTLNTIDLSIYFCFKTRISLHSYPLVKKDLYQIIYEALRPQNISNLFFGSHFCSIDMEVQKPVEISTTNTNSYSVMNVESESKSTSIHTEPFCQFGEHNDKYYICKLPLFVETSDEIKNNFINFNLDTINAIYNLFEKIETASLGAGIGNNNQISTLFSTDFDNIFESLNLFSNTENHSEILQKYKDLYIIPFYTLSSFDSAYNLNASEVVEKFTNWIRKFRTLIDVMDLLNLKHKKIRGFSAWLVNPISKESLKKIKDFNELKGLYEETILSNANEEEIYNLPLKIETFNDISAGVLCAFVNWSNDDSITLKKIIYPISHEDEKLINSLKETLPNNGNVTETCLDVDQINDKNLIRKLSFDNS